MILDGVAISISAISRGFDFDIEVSNSFPFSTKSPIIVCLFVNADPISRTDVSPIKAVKRTDSVCALSPHGTLPSLSLTVRKGTEIGFQVVSFTSSQRTSFRSNCPLTDGVVGIIICIGIEHAVLIMVFPIPFPVNLKIAVISSTMAPDSFFFSITATAIAKTISSKGTTSITTTVDRQVSVTEAISSVPGSTSSPDVDRSVVHFTVEGTHCRAHLTTL